MYPNFFLLYVDCLFRKKTKFYKMILSLSLLSHLKKCLLAEGGDDSHFLRTFCIPPIQPHQLSFVKRYDFKKM